MSTLQTSIQIPTKLLDGIKITGDIWTLCIIHILEKGPLRFCGIQRALGNINPSTLTNRLKTLERNGLIKRSEEIEDKLSVDYELTLRGKSITPILKSIGNFAEKNL